MNEIFMIEQKFIGCTQHWEIRLDYGFFLTLESALNFMRENTLPNMLTSETGDGFRPVVIMKHEEEE